MQHAKTTRESLKPNAVAGPAPAAPSKPAPSNAALQELLRAMVQREGAMGAGGQAQDTNPLMGILKHVGKVRAGVKQAAEQSGAFRVGMDNRFPGPGADRTAYISKEAAAQEYFGQRLEAARAFLREQGKEGTISAKLVTADIVNLAGQSPVEHAEWQLMLVPTVSGQRVGKEIDPKRAPGMFDEKRLDSYVREQGARSPGSPILRSEDNPLFLGRLNYGTAGSGMYNRVPDYAEIGGHKFNTREVEMIATASEEQIRSAISAMYSQQSRPYSVDGVCHQGAVLVGEKLGLDPGKVGTKIDSAWATNLKYGATGRNGR